MNKFEQGVYKYIKENTVLSDYRIVQDTTHASTLHDAEMVRFSEWCAQKRYLFDSESGKWDLYTSFPTTSELLTIFREENK